MNISEEEYNKIAQALKGFSYTSMTDEEKFTSYNFNINREIEKYMEHVGNKTTYPFSYQRGYRAFIAQLNSFKNNPSTNGLCLLLKYALRVGYLRCKLDIKKE